MYDFVQLILSVKETQNDLKDRAVIIAGGGYSGMLSAWLRMKYPHLF